MARYRKIFIKVWSDEKVRRLSRPQPNGQSLWFYLLTGKQTTQIPGVFSIGEMGMAELLDWPLQGFRKAFQEILSEGMVKANWRDRLVWVPKAIIYNKPESPNVVRSWETTWDDLPECELKAEIYETLKAFLEELGEGYLKAFEKSCRKPFVKTMANQETGNRSRIQEQEETHTWKQDLKIEKPEPEKRASAPACPESEILKFYHKFCPSLSKVQKITGARSAAIRARWRDHPDLSFWESFFVRVETSDFLCGRAPPGNGREMPFKADFEWIIKQANFVKILEGRYDNRRSSDGAKVDHWAEFDRKYAAEEAGGMP